MVLDHCFADELTALDLALIDDNFVVLSQLDFVVFDCLVKGFVSVVPLLDIVDNLEQIDGNRKYLSSGLQHLLVFFDLFAVLSLELDLILALSGWTLQHMVKLGLRLFDQLGWILSNMSRTLVLRVYSRSSSELLSSQYLRYSLM